MSTRLHRSSIREDSHKHNYADSSRPFSILSTVYQIDAYFLSHRVDSERSWRRCIHCLKALCVFFPPGKSFVENFGFAGSDSSTDTGQIHFIGLFHMQVKTVTLLFKVWFSLDAWHLSLTASASEGPRYGSWALGLQPPKPEALPKP